MNTMDVTPPIANIYTIRETVDSTDGLVISISLDPQHIIYQAHFPNHPITPGVVLLQVGKNLLEDRFNVKFSLNKLKNVKFLHPISPIEHPVIAFHYTIKRCDPFWDIVCTIRYQETLFVKSSFILEILND